MAAIPAKYNETIRKAVLRLLSSAKDSRGLSFEDVKPRIELALTKYLFAAAADPNDADVAAFIDEIRPDDLCIVLACEKGNEQAWEQMVTDFDASVRSAARKMTSNHEDADDLTSSIWAELYGLRQDADGNRRSKLSYYSGRGSLAGWLRAVVSQLAIDQHRKQSKLVQIEETREFENIANKASDAGSFKTNSYSADPEKMLIDSQVEEDVTIAVRKAINDLEAEDKLILKLYYFDDLKLKDIASAFGFHEATASRKLVRIQSGIRSSVEQILKADRGWTDPEVKRYLADTAAKLGLSMEKMFSIFIAAIILQDCLMVSVL